MSQKPNPEYWALKARTKKWGMFVLFIFPLFTLPTLSIAGLFMGTKLFSSNHSVLGFAIGGTFAYTLCFTLQIKKIGFLFQSKEKCQACGKPLAEWRIFTFKPYENCRWCGNDNRIELNK